MKLSSAGGLGVGWCTSQSLRGQNAAGKGGGWVEQLPVSKIVGSGYFVAGAE